MPFSYNKLDVKGKFKRTVILSFFAVIVIIMLFFTPQLSLEVKILLSLILTFVGIYQTRRDYLKFKRKTE